MQPRLGEDGTLERVRRRSRHLPEAPVATFLCCRSSSTSWIGWQQVLRGRGASPQSPSCRIRSPFVPTAFTNPYYVR